MLNKERKSWGIGDVCLIIYLVVGFTFLRARFGSFAIYTVFPIWFATTWLKHWSLLVANRYIRNVLFAFPLFLVAVTVVHTLNEVPFDRSLMQAKNYTYAFVGWLIFAYYYQMKNMERLRFYLLLGLAVAVANAGWNFFLEGKYAFASRTMTGGILERQIDSGIIDYDLVEALESGVASFGRVCSFAFMIPLLVYSMKYTVRKYKAAYAGAALVFALTVLRASYMLAVIYALIGLYTVLLARQRAVSVKQLWLVSLVVLVILFSGVLILATPILTALESYATLADNDVYTSKIQDIKIALETGDVYALPRIFNYRASAQLLASHFLVGVGYEGRLALGGHSQILDMLALEGLLGFLPYVALFAIANCYYTYVFEKGWIFFKNIRTVLWVPLMVACFTNPMDGYDVWLVYFFYAPALACSFQDAFLPPDNCVSGRPQFLRV